MKKSRILLTVLIASLLGCSKENHTNLIYQNTLTTADNTWFTNCNSERCFKFDQGGYSITNSTAINNLWSYVPCGLLNATFSMTVDCVMNRVDATKWGSVGIIFNAVDNTNYKMILISSLGHYQVFSAYQGTYTNLQAWTPSSAIKKGNGVVNTIAVQQNESTVEVTVNGVSLGVLPDTKSYNFKVGLVVGTATDFTPVTGAFKNLVIKKI
jgi:hypothetical protein